MQLVSAIDQKLGGGSLAKEVKEVQPLLHAQVTVLGAGVFHVGHKIALRQDLNLDILPNMGHWFIKPKISLHRHSDLKNPSKYFNLI